MSAHTSLPLPKNDELLTVNETSQYLRIPVPTVYYLVQRGQLPAIQIGGRWRIKRSLLDRDILKNDDGNRPRIVALHDDSATMGRELSSRQTDCARIVVDTIALALRHLTDGQNTDLFLLGDCAALSQASSEDLQQLFAALPPTCIVASVLSSHIDTPTLTRLAKRPITSLPHPLDYDQLRAVIKKL